MKKIFLTLLTVILMSHQVYGQTPPPLSPEDEDKPVDLSIGEPKRKAAPPPATTTTTTTTTPSQPQPVQPTPTPSTPTPTPPPATTTTTTITTTIPAPPVTLPPTASSPTPPIPAPTPTPTTPPPPEVVVPPSVPIVSVTTETTLETTSEDGGPKKDAGNDLTNALPITYSRYDENSLSSQDLIDTYKFYARTGEGIGIVMIPANTSSQLAVELLGEVGETLSQTQAPQPGAPIGFQTSPMTKNLVIYIRVKDINLLPASLPSDVRKYSLELKPIAAPIPPPQPTPPSAVEKSTTTTETVKEIGMLEDVWFLYGLVGIGVLVVLLLVLMLLRRTRRKKGDQ